MQKLGPFCTGVVSMTGCIFLCVSRIVACDALRWFLCKFPLRILDRISEIDRNSAAFLFLILTYFMDHSYDIDAWFLWSAVMAAARPATAARGRQPGDWPLCWACSTPGAAPGPRVQAERLPAVQSLDATRQCRVADLAHYRKMSANVAVLAADVIIWCMALPANWRCAAVALSAASAIAASSSWATTVGVGVGNFAKVWYNPPKSEI